MENKSPYVLIGAAVLVFLAGLVGFVVWKLRAGDATSYAYYSILFSGEVQGLTDDSPVFYRGLRVGRVTSISLTSRVEPQRGAVGSTSPEKIEVIVAVNSKIDIRERSYAVFEKPFIAGAAYIEIVGRLEVDEIKPKHSRDQKPYPEIREGASFLQVTSTSAQELLSKAGTTVDRLNELLNPDNIAAVSETLRSLSTVASGIAKQDANIQATLADLPPALVEFRKTFEKFSVAANSFAQIAIELGPQDEASRKALAGKTRERIAQDDRRSAEGDDEHQCYRRTAQQAGDRREGPPEVVLQFGSHGAIDDPSRHTPARRQLQCDRHQARTRPGRVRLQRQAGIHAQMTVCRAATLRRGGRMIAAVMLLAALSGCKILNAVTEPLDLYTVTPKSTFDPSLPDVFWQLTVEEPVAAGNLNTGRIAIAMSPTSSDYYSKTAWTDRLPLMVQTRIVEFVRELPQDRGGVAQLDRLAAQLCAANRSAQFRSAVLLRRGAHRARPHCRQAGPHA